MAWIPSAIMAADMVYESVKGKGGNMGGSSPKLKRYETLTHGEKKIHRDLLKRINPKALDILNSPLFKQSQGLLQNILGTSPEQQYSAFEKPIMSQFQQEIMPGIAERFAGMGAENSSGFQQAMGGAGANLAERLGMLKQGLMSDYQGRQMQAAGMGAQMAQMPISNMFQQISQAFGTPSFGYANMAGQPSFLQAAAPGMGQAFGNYMLGGWGGGGGSSSQSVGQGVNYSSYRPSQAEMRGW